MKLTKFTIIFIFIFTLALNVTAQKKPYKNEIDGYNFFESDKLNSIELAKSTEEDVTKFFGSNCELSCEYNSDWKITFMYYRDIEVIMTGAVKGLNLPNLKVNPKLLGKVALIRLTPQNKVSFANHKFSRKFRQIKGKLENRRDQDSVKIFAYNSYKDKKGLTYVIYDYVYLDTTNQENKDEYKKGDLLSIEYRPTSKQARNMFVKQK